MIFDKISASGIVRIMWIRYLELEKKLSHFLLARSITYLRISIAIIYLSFGFLKIVGEIPPALETIIFHASNWLKIPHFIVILGVWETLIGILLLRKKWLRWGLILLFLQFPGTFFPLFTHFHEYFPPDQGITFEGQYILKNIVYVAAALVLVASLHDKRKSD